MEGSCRKPSGKNDAFGWGDTNSLEMDLLSMKDLDFQLLCGKINFSQVNTLTSRRYPMKKDTKNAERCKQLREKRKQEKFALIETNRQLKQERAETLLKIAQLESQIFDIRGELSIDLREENEFLRRQVKESQNFINKICDLASQTTSISLEDYTQLLRCEAVHSIRQAAGLLYSSMANDSWIEDSIVPLSHGRHARMWYQCVPTGSDPSTALRVNVRFDVENTQATSKELADATRRIIFNVQLQNEEFAQNQGFFSDVKDEMLTPETMLSTGERVLCGRVSWPSAKPTQGFVYVSVEKDIFLDQSAYSFKNYERRSFDPIKAEIFLSGATTANFEKSAYSSAFEMILGTGFEASIFPSDDRGPKNVYSYVVSVPINDPILAGMGMIPKNVTNPYDDVIKIVSVRKLLANDALILQQLSANITGKESTYRIHEINSDSESEHPPQQN